ncbi:MAG: response regulator [Ruminococcaceae bacterium]|nr:response regulator [Oscillospiraceae bacterium]
MSTISKILKYIAHIREKRVHINKGALNICFVLLSIYAFIMSIICFIKPDVVMGIVNVVIGCVMLLSIVIILKVKSHAIVATYVLTFLYLLMMVFLCEGGVGGVSVIWHLFIPIGGMALINLYYGSILSFMVGISTTLYMLTPLHELAYHYNEDYRIRFPIIYWAFTTMTLFIFIRIDRFEETQKQFIKEADDSNRAKSEFLANMSHELRTPMNAIMGMCEITLKEDIPDNIRENNESIYHSSKDLMNIINDLLDFSKIGSGRMELSCSQYRLSDVIKDVVHMASARKGSKPLAFVVECDPDIPDLLYGDDMRIKQIMINLLTNAIKYTQEGGFLLKLSHRKESYGINLIISVQDSGIGIKNENIDKIFDVYGRVDAEKTHKIEGTGLGLPITKKLVRLMNGVIGVTSVYGEGTEFKVVIPQNVVDEAPIVNLEKNECTGILCYYNADNLPNFADEALANTFNVAIDKLGKAGYICKNLESLKDEVSTGAYSHIFIGKDEFFEDEQYFKELSETYSVTVVRDKTDQFNLGGNITGVYKPFYINKLCAAISKPVQKKAQNEAMGDNFTAPNANILVVDDNALNLRVARGLMKQYGMKIDIAKSGAQALQLMVQKKYDMVFLDHLMPDMDGVETHRAIKELENESDRKTPVIALTAYTAADVRDMFTREGFQGFMSKPIQADILKDMLLNWLPKEHIIYSKEPTNE